MAPCAPLGSSEPACGSGAGAVPQARLLARPKPKGPAQLWLWTDPAAPGSSRWPGAESSLGSSLPLRILRLALRRLCRHLSRPLLPPRSAAPAGGPLPRSCGLGKGLGWGGP